MRELDQDAVRMVCSISAGGIGICLTGISLMRVVVTVRHSSTIADDLLAANALLFLATMIVAYCSIRMISQRRLLTLERVADSLFLLSTSMLTLNCFVVAYAFSAW